MRRVLVMTAILALAACGTERMEMPRLTALSPPGARQIDPSISPDGSRIAYWSPVADIPGQWELWVANLDLSAPAKVGVTTLLVGPPLWSPDGRVIATTSSQFGAADVVVVPAAGGDVRRVTSVPGAAIPVGWFPDGDRLAVLVTQDGSYSARVFSLSTGADQPLIPGETRLHLGTPSPDGAHIAYLVIEGSRSTLWLADGDGRNGQALTTEGFESPTGNIIQWSPDSRQVAFTSRRTGTTDVWAVATDGSAPRQLTRDVRNDFGEGWSPDGRWVSFNSQRGRQSDLWIVAADGGAELRVTDSRELELTPVTWLPSSDALIYSEVRFESAVWIRDLDSGRERQLTPDSVEAAWFNLSPDGRWMNYVTVRGGGVNDLVVAPLDGSSPPRVLFGGNGLVFSPRWSPDGTKILFRSDRGGSPDPWVLDVASGEATQVVDWSSAEFDAVWSSDGAILFTSDSGSALADLWRVSAEGGEPRRLTRNSSAGGGIFPLPSPGGAVLGTLGTRGELGLSTLRPDGRLTPLWTRSNAPGAVVTLPTADSIITQVQQPDGAFRVMMLATDGSGGRVLLGPNEISGATSPDGASMLYYLTANGAADLGVVELATGETRRLTTTPEIEGGAEFTPDGRAVLFQRSSVEQRLMRADLRSLMTAPR